MIRSIKYWLKSKIREWKGLCQICGVDPINNKRPITDDPFYSDTCCRFCMKHWLHASNYGMNRKQLIETLARIK